MNPIVDAFVAIRGFFEAGGPVLYWVLMVTIIMWTLIIERMWFLYFILPDRVKAETKTWNNRNDQTSWAAKRIREGVISRVSLDANRFILSVKALMAVLPLVGLLGTVWGMVEVFNIMTLTGTGNARLMAGGVSQATIPTMSGLVAALSGLFFSTHLDSKANREVEHLEDNLRHH